MANPETPLNIVFHEELKSYGVFSDIDKKKEHQRQDIFYKKFFKFFFRMGFEMSNGLKKDYILFLEKFRKNLSICNLDEKNFYENIIKIIYPKVVLELISRKFYLLNNEFLSFTKIIFNFKNKCFNLSNSENFLLHNPLDLSYCLLYGISNSSENDVKNIMEFLECYSSKILDYYNYDEVSNENIRALLKKHSNNSNFFNSIINASNMKVKNLLFEIITSQKKEAQEKLIEESPFYPRFFGKIKRLLDNYICLMRFTSVLLKIPQYSNIDPELIYFNFQKIFSCSIYISELHIFCAMVACEFIKIFIKDLKFEKYKGIVLEKFLILLIMLIQKYKTCNIFLPYLSFISDSIKPEDCYKNEFFFISLLREELICVGTYDRSKFENIFLPCQKFYPLNDDNTDSIITNIQSILKNLRKRNSYENYVYLKLLEFYLNNEKILYALIRHSEFNKIISNKVAKIIYRNDYLIQDKCHFQSILETNLIRSFFRIINKLNLQIKEYFKQLDPSTFENINYLNDKLLKKIGSKLNLGSYPDVELLIAKHSIESYKYIIDYNSNNGRQIDLITFFKKPIDNSIYFNNIDEKLLKLQCMKAYLLYTKQDILKWDKNPDAYNKEKKLIKLVEILTNLCDNINFNKKEEEKALIQDLNTFFNQTYSISYTLKENILNSTNPSKSVSDLQNYYYILMDEGTKEEHMHALSFWKLIETILDNKQMKLNCNYKQNYDNNKETINKFGLLIHGKHNFENSEIKKQCDTHFKKFSKEAYKNIIHIREGYSIYNDMLKNIDFLKIFGNLEKFGYYKTCLASIENYINKILKQKEKFLVSEFDEPEILRIYKRCYSSLEDYENVFKNYIPDNSIGNLLNNSQENKQIQKNLVRMNFKINIEEFFLTGSLVYLTKFLKEYKNKIELKILYKKACQRTILTFIKILFNCILSDDKDESEKFKNSFEFNIVITIQKILNGKEYNFYLSKIYYELLEISNSAFKYKISNFEKSENNKKILDDIDTIKLIKSLFKSRCLNPIRSNLIHLKFRRIICKYYNITDLEQIILSDIIKIYRNDKKPKKNDHLIPYLNQYCENFKKNPTNLKELYNILKFLEFLNKKEEFMNYFKDYNELIISSNNYHEFMILNFKIRINNYTAKDTIYGEIKTALQSRARNLDKIDTIISNILNNKNGKMSIKNIVGSIQDKNLIYILDYKVGLLSQDISLDKIYKSKAHIKEQIENIQTIIIYMSVICIGSKSKDRIFNNLPKLLNLIYKYHEIINNSSLKSDLKEDIKNYSIFLVYICKELEILDINKVSHIQQQLIMSYFLEKDSPIYNMAVALISKYCDQYIHENAYWLSSFKIPDYSIFNSSSKKMELKSLAEKRNEFASKIYRSLSKENQNIIENYIEFQSSLKSIPYLGKNTEHDKIKDELRKINGIISKHEFILPEKKNLRKDILDKKETKEIKLANFSQNESHYLNIYNTHSMRLEVSLAKISEVNEYEDENSNNFDVKNINSSMKTQINNEFKNNSNFKAEELDSFIDKVDLKYEIMSSKERPVKITFISKAGKKHNFLLKCDSEDILKEVKAMDVFMAIDKIFKHEKLDINYNLGMRVYDLVPISQCSIIIEWVENAKTIKEAICPQYEKFGLKYLDEFKQEASESEKFYRLVKPDSNVLYQYFLDKYPEPNEWFEAKKRYLLSTAVWSMAGYFLGLNDRHLQNIMIDELGEIIHIDYGYLLSQGKTLKVPEIVDFRFTRNFRRALGIFEENGPFIFFCEQVLKVFTRNFSYLFTKLESLIIDPNCPQGLR